MTNWQVDFHFHFHGLQDSECQVSLVFDIDSPNKTTGPVSLGVSPFSPGWSISPLPRSRNKTPDQLRISLIIHNGIRAG